MVSFVAGFVIGQTRSERARPALDHVCALVGNASCFCAKNERMEIRKNVMLCWES